LRWNGSGWTQVNGSMKQVAVAGDGTVWAVAPNGQIFSGTTTTVDAPPPAPAPSANGKTVMLPGEVLRAGESLVAANHMRFTTMQADGQLCSHSGTPGSPGSTLWCSGSFGTGGKFVAFVGVEGNLCVRQGDEFGGTNIWCTNKVTAAGSAFVRAEDDGSLKTYAGSPQAAGALLWANPAASVVIAAPLNGAVQWPDGMLCPPDCGRVFQPGTPLTLTAKPSGGFAFESWGFPDGPCAHSNQSSCAFPPLDKGLDRSWSVSPVVFVTPATFRETMYLHIDGYDWSRLLSPDSPLLCLTWYNIDSRLPDYRIAAAARNTFDPTNSARLLCQPLFTVWEVTGDRLRYVLFDSPDNKAWCMGLGPLRDTQTQTYSLKLLPCTDPATAGFTRTADGIIRRTQDPNSCAFLWFWSFASIAAPTDVVYGPCTQPSGRVYSQWDVPPVPVPF
jgi:hypothetical protein